MSRFYKTSQSNPVDWAYQLPYQEMMQGVLSKQAVQDQGIMTAEKISALGQDISYLDQDRDAALAQVDWLNKGVDELTRLDLTDPTNKRKLKDFSREYSRRWGKSGIVGNIQNSVAARNAYIKSLDDNKDLTDPVRKKAAIRAWDDRYKGVGDNTPYGGRYNTYQGQMLSPDVDIMSEWYDIVKDIENDKVTRSGSTLAGMYIDDWEEYDSLPNAERIAKVWKGYIGSQKVQNYLKDNYMYGIQGPDLDSILIGGVGKIGTEEKELHKLKNNSWANKQAEWEREDAQIDLYTQLYDQVYDTGFADMSNTPIKSVYPNGVVETSQTGYLSMSPQLNQEINALANQHDLPMDLIIAYLNMETAPSLDAKQTSQNEFKRLSTGVYAPYMNTVSRQALAEIKRNVGDKFDYLPPLIFGGQSIATVEKVNSMVTLGGQAFNEATVKISPDENGKYGGRNKDELEYAMESGVANGSFDEEGNFITNVTIPYKFDQQKQNTYNSGRGQAAKRSDQRNLQTSVVTKQYADIQDRLQKRFLDELYNSNTYSSDNPRRVIVEQDARGNMVYKVVSSEERSKWELDNSELIQKIIASPSDYSFDASTDPNDPRKQSYNK